MPKVAEVCTVNWNGRTYGSWKTVSVERDCHAAVSIATLTVVEKVDRGASFAAMQMKPGDQVSVFLAGMLILSGHITIRQTSYDRQSHGVMIVIKSFTGDLVESSAPLKASQYKDYPLEPIVRKLIEPFGLSLSVINPSQSFSKKFKDVNVTPGESVWSLIESLARTRGMHVHDDENGALVLGRAGSGSGGSTLQEGVNILSANCSISDESAVGKIEAKTQQRGDDNTTDEQARKPAGSIDGPASRYKPVVVVAEHPGDSEDMATRVQHERDINLGSIINASITVKGWIAPGGGLWKIRDIVTINSPMLLLNGQQLGIKAVLFTQADQIGTITVLTLVRPEMLGAIEPGLRGGNNGNVLPGGDASTTGQPEDSA